MGIRSVKFSSKWLGLMDYRVNGEWGVGIMLMSEGGNIMNWLEGIGVIGKECWRRGEWKEG